MLSTHFFSKCRIALPYQWLNITFLAMRSNSRTSGSSSSDSDSDSDSGNKNTNKSKNVDYLRGTEVAQKKRKIEKQIVQAAQLLNEKGHKEHEREKVVANLLGIISKIQKEDTLLKSSANESKEEWKGQKKRTGMKFIEKDRVREERSTIESTKFQEKRPMGDKRRTWTYHSSGKPSVIEMLAKQEAKSDEIEKAQQRVKQPMSDKRRTWTYHSSGEPSVIEMLAKQEAKSDEIKKAQQRVKQPMSDKRRTRTYHSPGEPSVIEILAKQEAKSDEIEKAQQRIKEPMSDKRRTRTYHSSGEPSVIEMLAKQEAKSDKIEKAQWREDKPSVIRTLKKQQWKGRKFERFGMNVTEKLGTEQKVPKKWPEDEADNELERHSSLVNLLLSPGYDEGTGDTEFNEIFNSEFTENPDIPALKVWNMCEQRELKSMVKFYPRNAFQEMIDWTNEGKLWHFPINNEQGMKEEENVHFSKHVFLERHLSPWCPTKGPIRHFMELVCVGLSKNPYMTIQEKYDHIAWYKDYFKEKQDLLQKLGLVE